MGHDISAFLKSKNDNTKNGEIAYIQRGAFNPLNEEIYKALDCMEDNYCGVSGCGKEVEFTLDQIKDALRKVHKREDLEKEQKFLRDCIEADDGSGFVIHFY